MIGGALYVRVTLQGLARPCISLTSHLATFCTFADGVDLCSEIGHFVCTRNQGPCFFDFIRPYHSVSTSPHAMQAGHPLRCLLKNSAFTACIL